MVNILLIIDADYILKMIIFLYTELKCTIKCNLICFLFNLFNVATIIFYNYECGLQYISLGHPCWRRYMIDDLSCD